ncbi:hypothetical protein FD755_024538 [Muntiacus reevesi]|uniref:E2F/DP family winged-helix DNA-binding domain-containing protein n=1 Tax=Muntiacus reevesi TaxID=9886 RepID=A0A5N3UW64_MUNRE|nr:hypothetical protein FD755_024538 [Muntiacus reevesi]
MSQQQPARKLPSPLVDPAEEARLLPSKIRINLEDNVQYVSMRKALKVKRPRFDVSLVYLTRKFMDLVRSAPGGILDLNKFAAKLGVRKQRVYDITSVLDGIDLVEKKSKNNIRWIGSDFSNFGAVPQQNKLQEELSDLPVMEDALLLAYVTYQDTHSIQAFHEQIVIAVKAPADTRLDSSKGPTDIYLCEVEQGSHSINKTSDSVGTSSSKKENSPQQSEEVVEVTSCGV